MINQIYTLFSDIFEFMWQTFENILNAIDGYQSVLSVAAIAVISRFILYPIFRGGISIRSFGNIKSRPRDRNNNERGK